MSADDIIFTSAREQAAMIGRREVSAVELLEAHNRQVDEINPTVNAVVNRVPERAMAAAQRVDDDLSAGRPVGPLAGLPMAHKDYHHVAGIPTTFGSPVLADSVPEADELIIERLHQAGVVTTGKTNVPEFLGAHTYNSLFGTTLNPYALDRTAGGSSGGAAVAVACGMQPFADGSDMGGSLRFPAAFNNVVGLRPTPGRVPTYPMSDAWFTLRVQGPIARSVDDIAFLLETISGPDARSPLSLAQAPITFDGSRGSELNGARIAWSPDLGGAIPVEADVDAVLKAAPLVFESLGCLVEESSPELFGADEAFRVLRAANFSASMADFYREHRDEMNPNIAGNIETGLALSGVQVARAHQLQSTVFHRMREFFERYDALILPVSSVAPFDAGLDYPHRIADEAQQDYLSWMRSCYLISVAGCPALSLPGGFTADGLPVGLQIVAGWGRELDLLRIGRAFEAATGYGARRPPAALRTGGRATEQNRA